LKGKIIMGLLLLWSLGFAAGFTVAYFMVKKDREEQPELSATVTDMTPQAQTKLAGALYHAGIMLEHGAFEYVSGGFVVQDLGHGVVTFRGDLSLRATDVDPTNGEDEAPKGRDFIGMKRDDT
jgi:hypothetical protein